MTTNLRLDRCPIIFFAVTLTILFLLSSMPSYAATIHAKTPRASCRIEIGNAHVSTHIKEVMGIKAVKVNAESICNVTQSNVRLTVQIYKVGYFRDYLISERSTNPLRPTSYGTRVKNQETFRRCTSNRKSSFYGIAFSEAIIAGQKSAAPPTRSPKIVSLQCGT